MVDASRARLFTLRRSSDTSGLSETLDEQRDLVNPARRLRAGELFTESRPSLARSGNVQYGFDDHRDEHIEQMDTVFSKLVADELMALVRASNADRVIVCASPNMLGALRGTQLAQLKALDEIPRNLVKLTPTQLREQLASYGVLPARPERPIFA